MENKTVDGALASFGTPVEGETIKLLNGKSATVTELDGDIVTLAVEDGTTLRLQVFEP
jgi:hypothetical protein